MKILVLAFGLLCCAGHLPAQQKLYSFEELYSYLEKEYIDKDYSFLTSIEAGLYKMCDYRNVQTVPIKQKLEPAAQRTGRTVAELFIDSMFAGVSNILIPRKYHVEFAKLEKELQFFSDQYCHCSATVKGKDPADKLNNSLDCFLEVSKDSPFWDSIMIKSYPSDLKQVQNSLGAYIFNHCPAFLALLKQHLYSGLPEDDDMNDVESLLFQKMRVLRGYWKRQSMDSLAGIFPGYAQYAVQLEKALSPPSATMTNEFDIKRNTLRQPVLEYTYYTGHGNSLKIIYRVVYTFSSHSASCVISSLEIIPFEKIPGVKQLQQKMRENTRTNIKPPVKRKN